MVSKDEIIATFVGYGEMPSLENAYPTNFSVLALAMVQGQTFLS